MGAKKIYYVRIGQVRPSMHRQSGADLLKYEAVTNDISVGAYNVNGRLSIKKTVSIIASAISACFEGNFSI